MIYVIHESQTNYIKIGKALDPEKRLKTLQTGNALKLSLLLHFAGNIELEHKIHRDLEAYRVSKSGEWFYYRDEVKEYLSHFYEPETEVIGEKEFIVLRRSSEDAPTGFCPFCGLSHTHGVGDGHRNPHCESPLNDFTRLRDGKIFPQNSGYIVKTDKQ